MSHEPSMLKSDRSVFGECHLSENNACKCCLLFTSAANIQVHYKLNFFMGANNMNPNETAPNGTHK